MGVTLLYDLLGGMRAVVIDDLLQLILLSITVLFSLWLLGEAIGLVIFSVTERTTVIRDDWGADCQDYGLAHALVVFSFTLLTTVATKVKPKNSLQLNPTPRHSACCC